MKKINYIISILCLSLICSCNNEDDSNTDVNDISTNLNSEIDVEKFQVLSGEWVVKNIQLNTETILVPPDIVDIIFSEEQQEETTIYNFNGSAICNTYGGQLLSLATNEIDFQQLFATEQSCEPDPDNTFEELYYDVLSESQEYEVNIDTLIVRDETNRSITFEKRTPSN